MFFLWLITFSPPNLLHGVFGGADVPLAFWGARRCVVHWVGSS